MRYSKRTGYGYAQRGKPPRTKGAGGLGAPLLAIGAVLLVCVAVGSAAVLGVFEGVRPSAPSKGSPASDAGAVFAEGVTMDGVDISGLTTDAAGEAIAAAQQARADAFAVTVADGNAKLTFTNKQVQVTFNTGEALQHALETGAGSYTTTLSADPSAIEQRVLDFAQALSVPPIDSIVLSFDPTKPDGQRFTFSDDRPGKHVDGPALWAAVKQAFESGESGTVQVESEPVEAAVRKADLEANCKLIVSFQSKMLDHSKERLANITLAADTVTKRIIAPGGEFSFNGATGERSKDKGYQVAHVISAGVEDNGLGGGVCQVSGTLFNAAARADLEIVKRSPHTIPSTYLKPPGTDATVDYPKKDLVLRNNGKNSVIIVIKVDQASPWTVTAEIYGVPLPAGETIDLYCKVNRKLPALTEPKWEDSEAVQPGTVKLVKAREGYEITVYKIYKKDGVEVNRVKIDTIRYEPSGPVYLYYRFDTKPAEYPTATPAATPAPAATPDPPPAPTEAPAAGTVP